MDYLQVPSDNKGIIAIVMIATQIIFMMNEPNSRPVECKKKDFYFWNSKFEVNDHRISSILIFSAFPLKYPPSQKTKQSKTKQKQNNPAKGYLQANS